MKKLWGGRFKKKTAREVEEFTSSLSFDKWLIIEDLKGSHAHALMLGKTRIISKQEAKRLAGGIIGLLRDITQGKMALKLEGEDVHTMAQNILRKRLGNVVDKLHTARSRNDQVVLDVRLYAKRALKNILVRTMVLQNRILYFSKIYKDVIIPGYTHLQQAQPVLLSHQMLAYMEMLRRDEERLADAYKRVDIMPLGSGALAGTSLPIDRDFVAKELGFKKVSTNSIDAVSDRDFILEVMSADAILMMHLSRLCEDLILWTTKEFGILDIDESFCTGSSIMPQKKNPDVLELVRGKTGRVYGRLVSLLVTMKGLPLSYNRDMQEDKEAFFDSVDTTHDCLRILSGVFSHMKVNRRRAKELAGDEFLLATDLAEYLVKKKVSFKDAHCIVGKLVRKCIAENKKFSDLTLGELKVFSLKFDKDIYGLLSPEASVKSRCSAGGTSPKEVNKAIKYWESEIRFWQRKSRKIATSNFP